MKYLFALFAAAVAVNAASIPPSSAPNPISVITGGRTNAERLRNGERIKAPTRVVARRAAPSPSPSMIFNPGNPMNPGGNSTDPTMPGNSTEPMEPPVPPECGRLLVNATFAEQSGYVQAELTAGIYMVVNSTDGAVLVRYSNHTLIPQNGSSSYPLIGAAAFFPNTPPVDELGDGSANVAPITRTGDTPYGEPGQNIQSDFYFDPNFTFPTQSSIWYLDMASGEVTAQWVNPDGSFYLADFVLNSSGQMFLGDGEYYEPQGVSPARIFCENFLPVSS